VPNKINILFASHTCYLDTYNGASVATRSLMECLARRGFAVEALSGSLLESTGGEDFALWLARREFAFEKSCDPLGQTAYRTHASGVAVTLCGCPTTIPHIPDEAERRSFIRIFQETIDRFRPDIVVNFGGDPLATEIRRRARASNSSVVFALHNFNYNSPTPFADVDAIIVPSRFAASYYRKTLGIECKPLPNLVNFDLVRASTRIPRYVTFVNPSYEKGVFVFARIADELGLRRPDIPLLVVESRGTERTLVDCGVDLRAYGNVSLMAHTPDPRHFWGVTRICVMPSLWWENQPLVAVEAMINGVPVIGSDRGGFPETLGDGGIVLGIPARLTPETRELPTSEEVNPWVKTIIGLWDDPAWYSEQSRRALAETHRWMPEVLEPQYVRFFEDLRPLSELAKGEKIIR